MFVCLWACMVQWLSNLQALKCSANMHAYWFTRIHTHIASPNRYTCTFPTVISSVSRETSSLSWYTSHKWIFNPVPPGGYLRKGFNWFKMNNYEPHFPAKSIFIHGCLHSGAVVLGWLGCTPLFLLVSGRDMQCGCPFISGLRDCIDDCIAPAPAQLHLHQVCSHAGSGAWVTVTTHSTPVLK